MGNGPINPVHVALFGSLDNFPLLAVPLFIIAGEIMGRGGIARRLVEWALSIVGARARLAGTRRGRVVGAVRVDVGIECRLRRRHRKGDDTGTDPSNGYNAVFSGSLIASCGAIATIIPPSITMIIYGVAAQVSVPKLFLAGFRAGSS